MCIYIYTYIYIYIYMHTHIVPWWCLLICSCETYLKYAFNKDQQTMFSELCGLNTRSLK